MRPVVLMILLALSAFSPAQARSEEILVAVASNFNEAMVELAAAFEKQSGHQVRVAFGSSGNLTAQIKNGAPFQAFFSADQAKPRLLETEGLGVAGSRFTYAIGALALWSSDPERVVDDRALKRLNFNKLAIANPKLAPYGAAAVQVLDNLNLLEATQKKWVQGENIAQTYQFVSTGNAELGLVALSQVVRQGQIRQGSAWVVPGNLYDPIRQDAVLLQKGRTSPATRALLDFMRTKTAGRIISRYGYQLEQTETP